MAPLTWRIQSSQSPLSEKRCTSPGVAIALSKKETDNNRGNSKPFLLGNGSESPESMKRKKQKQVSASQGPSV